MLRKRTISSLWIAALVIAAVWFGDPGYTILIATVGALAVLEFYKMVSRIEVIPLTYFGLIWTLLFVTSRNSVLLTLISPYFNVNLIFPLLILSTIVIPFIWLSIHSPKKETFARWIWTTAGIFYVGWMLSHLVALRGFENGRNWVLLVVFVTFASDTTAFFVGRSIGRHYLAPRISPSKTWEGAISGVCVAMTVSTVFVLYTPFNLSLSYWQVISLAMLVSIVGQLGDLLESLLKRITGVKDSGTLIPGHGGVLDRLDSVIFAGLVIYYYIIFSIL